MRLADIVIKNGTVYTADKDNEFAEALAIKNNRIMFVGSESECGKYIDAETRVIDMEGGMLLPGMIDSHIHAPGNKLYELFDIDLNNINTAEEVLEAISEFIEKNPDEPAYYGSGLHISLFSDGEESSKGPKKERLDAICSDKLIMINTDDMHSAWANSKAFEIAGIDAATPDPEGGRIERNEETNEPWGTLREKASISMLPEQQFTAEQRIQAVKAFQEMMHSLGITGIFSLPGIIDVTSDMYEMAKNGTLELRTTAAYYVWPEKIAGKPIIEQIDEAVWQRDNWVENTDLFKVTTLKYACDGVVEGVTAGVIEAYAEGAGKAEDYHGEFLFTEDEMNYISNRAAVEGLQVHAHSIGDLATKKVLDSYEQTTNWNKDGGVRNTITHLQLVDSADIARFTKLNVIAAVQPYWMKKEPVWWEKIEKAFLGGRAEHEYPLKSFLDENVVVTSSSDHGVTAVPYPMVGIEGGVTRNLTTAEDYGVDDITDMDDPQYLMWKEERAGVADMIDSFTINGAYQGFREQTSGSLKKGKFADMIIIDRNIFECDPVDIEKTVLKITIFDGKVVYER